MAICGQAFSYALQVGVGGWSGAVTCVRRLVVDGDRRARAEDSRGVMQRSAICHCSCLACRLTATAWRTHTQCTRCACTYVKIKCFLCKLCRLTAGFCQRVRCFVLLCKASNMLLLGVSPPVLAAAAAQDQVDPLHTAHGYLPIHLLDLAAGHSKYYLPRWQRFLPRARMQQFEWEWQSHTD